MAPRLGELIGRAMVDPEFFGELKRAPDAVLAAYDLTEEERDIVRQALARLSKSPASHAGELRNVLLRRVAT